VKPQSTDESGRPAGFLPSDHIRENMAVLEHSLNTGQLFFFLKEAGRSASERRQTVTSLPNSALPTSLFSGEDGRSHRIVHLQGRRSQMKM